MHVIKKVGTSGQVSLGKEYAGKNVMIEQVDKGVWIIKTGDFIPDNEKWLHSSKVAKDLDEAIEWAEKHPPKEANLNTLEKKLK